MKYMGSKSRIAKYIIPIIQDYINKNNITTFIDLFCGGANIVDKIKCENRIANDSNKYLIALFQALQKEQKLPSEVSRELYSDVRSNKDNYEDWYVGCIGFLSSYNGRFFDGGFAQPGYEKTKNGERYRDYYRESKDNILEQINQENFKNINFTCNDYREFFQTFPYKENCLIYCDPPYQNTKQYGNSKDFDYKLFWNTMRKLSTKTIVLISEENAPNDFECIWEQKVSRSIKSTDKSVSIEKLFKWKGE